MTVPRMIFARVLPLNGRLAWRAAGAGLVLALLLGLLPVRVQAQPTDGPPIGVIISVNGNERRKMTTGKRIKKIAVSDPTRVNVVPDTPESIFIVGLSPGIAKVTLTDENDKVESFDVVVVQFDIRQLEQVLKRAVPTGNIRPVPAGNNGVIIQGTVDRAEDMQVALQAAQSVVGGLQIINNIRVGGVQQVQLDVVVAQVSRSELRAMAFNFLSNGKAFYLASTVGQAVVNPATVGAGGVLDVTYTGAQTLLGAPGFPNGLPTNILAGVLHDSWGFLGFLQALRTEGVLKLMAEPRLVTMSGRQASFLSGGEQAVPVPAGLGQVGVQFEEFGTRLNFIPVVLGNGKIHLEVEPEVSFLDPAAGTVIGGTTVPGRSTQRVRTTVELEAGQTFVIGGLIQHQVNASTIKVPILGDLPFIGAAFSSKSYNESESELLVLVTPHLVDGIDCSQYPQCLPGQETRTPDDFELFLEGILEAPRGQREVCQDKTYVPAYKNGPTSGMFPCGDSGHHGHHGHHGGLNGKGFCFGGNCPTCPGPVAPTVPAEVQHHTARKMPDGQQVPIREVSPVTPGKPEVIRSMPEAARQPLPMPATLPPVLEAPMLPRP